MQTIRVPFPPAILLTFVLTLLLLYAAYLLAPEAARLPILLCAGLMIIVVAFTSVELTLYLLIFSTLLSPELTFGGGGATQVVSGQMTTTESRGITLRLDDILLSLVALTWMFRMAIYQELGSVRQTPINQPITWYWLMTLFATIAGFYAGRVGLFGFFFVLKYLEYFLLFYMIINHLHDHESIKRYLFILLLTCAIASLAGIAQIPSGARVSAPFEGAEGEPNTFGGYLMFMFSIALGIFLYARRMERKWQTGILMGLILVPFVFTESRSSYLAFVVAIGLFILLSEHKRLLVLSCLVGLALAPFVLPRSVVERMTYTFTQTKQSGQLSVGGIRIDTSTSQRLMAWKDVVSNDFPKHPILGVGVTGGRFLDAQYPRILLEVGIIGFALFIWLLRRIWVTMRQCYAELEDPLLKGAALGATCGFGGLLVHAIGANTFIIVRIMEPLMVVLGLLLAALFVQRQQLRAGEENTDLQSAPAGGG